VKVPGVFETAEGVLNLPVKAAGDTVVRLRDIASVHRTFKDPEGFARINGRPALALEVKKRIGANIVDTVAEVRRVVEAERRQWPPTLTVDYIQDKSDNIASMLLDLQNNLLSAILLVMIVVVAALGLRSAGLVGLAVPGSFLAGILVLGLLGLTINIVVLFALILAVGMLVDGAIVVTEFADRKMAEGMPGRDAYQLAAKRMAWPITASTATTVAAFLPLLFWPGIVGEFMKFLPITLVATLTASLVMALIFVPNLGALVGKAEVADPETMKLLSAAEQGDLTQLRGLAGFYVRLLRRVLQRPVVVLLAAVAIAVGTYAATPLRARGGILPGRRARGGASAGARPRRSFGVRARRPGPRGRAQGPRGRRHRDRVYPLQCVLSGREHRRGRDRGSPARVRALAGTPAGAPDSRRDPGAHGGSRRHPGGCARAGSGVSGRQGGPRSSSRRACRSASSRPSPRCGRCSIASTA
jgi:multidrug efflux pump subunit AcrB